MKKGKLTELQDMFRVGGKIPPGRKFSSQENTKTIISVALADGSSLNIESDQVTITFDRDLQEVTTRSDQQRVYMVDKGIVTIVAKL